MTEQMKAILADPAASYWLKEAIRALLSRDALDAANDAELLAKLFSSRLDAMLEYTLGQIDLAECLLD